MKNDGIIEVKGKSGSKKKLIILLSICVTVFILIVAIIKFLPRSAEEDIPPKPASADNSALQRATQEDKGLQGRIQEIKQEINREKEEERKAAEKAAEAERKRQEEERRKEEEKATKNSDAVEQIKQNQPPSASTSTSPQDENKPLPKHLRILTGETLVVLNNQTQPKTEEKDSDDLLQGSTFANGSASVIKNRKWLLAAGTSLSCVLKTKIVTSYQSPAVMCQLTKDVYSDNGEMLLARAGAMLIGEQKQAIAQGIARVFVTWTNIKDGNINVRIDALGADGLGASGLPAWIDNHFWERFGNSMLLSLIDDSLTAASTHLAKSGSESNGITFDNTSDTGKKMAEIALENSINIPPTAYINQGELLTVIVPRNIDFSSVYESR